MRITTNLPRVALVAGLLSATSAFATNLTPVPFANTKAPGYAPANLLSSELREVVAAQGSMRLENPTSSIGFYGYNTDGPMLPLPGAIQSPGNNVEATKTEPDKNTYLVLLGQHGVDANYDYGKRFLYQGHEAGVNGQGYLTRVNLDADAAHRVTLLASTDVNGQALPNFDGSTWYPFSQRLLFTAELGNRGGVWQATVDFPSTVEDISGVTGRGGYEGIQADIDGNLIIVEDVGGKTGAVNRNARQPNSFIYRLIPNDPRDLKLGGRLQALQVMSKAHPGPIVFHAGDVDGDITSQDMKDLHTYGNVFDTRWVTIHDTSINGMAPFDANALAKGAGATPFKRPENGQFRPGSGFHEFFFDETGDTNANTEAANFGGFGSIMRLIQSSGSDAGKLTMFYKGDVTHTGFDNVAFWSEHEIVFVEDAGDGLHGQRNALDSAYLFDLSVDYSNPANQPVRVLAQGRDPSATIDAGLGSIPGSGFQNDGDNEITGLHVSDGDPTFRGLLGAKIPQPFDGSWRVFYTQQHGDNVTWEIVRADKRLMPDNNVAR